MDRRQDYGILLIGSVLAIFIILFREAIRELMPNPIVLFLSNLQMRVYNEILLPLSSLDAFSIMFVCVIFTPVIIIIGTFFIYPVLYPE